MAFKKENIKAIEANPELKAKLKELQDKDSPILDFYDVLTAAGIDVTEEDLEETYAELQKMRGEAIADLERVDREQLRQVAGGGTGIDCSGAGDCDCNFKLEKYQAKNDRCSFRFYCDEYLGEIGENTYGCISAN